MENVLPLRPVDRKRLDSLQERAENPLTSDDIGYVHTVMSQCFLPYRDPKTLLWQRSNGKYSIPKLATTSWVIVAFGEGGGAGCSRAVS